MNKTINIDYTRNLSIGDLLTYIVEIYGKEIYLQPQQLVGLLADLMNGSEADKRIYKRAIIDDHISEKIYRIVTEYGEDEIYIKKLTKQFEDINGYRTQLAESVINNFVYAIVDIYTTATEEDGEFIDEFGVKYSRDGKKLIKANRQITEYKIKEGTKIICKSAFSQCYDLETIHLPNSLTHIGDWAFGFCENLQIIDLPNSLTYIGKNTFARYLRTINLPDSLTHIRDSAFSCCEYLQTINVSSNNLNFRSIDGVIYSYDLTRLICYPAGKKNSLFHVPNGVKYIRNNAFSGYRSNNLQTINLPDSLSHISDSAFSCCEYLQAINVSSNNLNLRSIDGVLFSYDLTRLICYPTRKRISSFHVPHGVNYIGNYTFSKCKNLQTIYLPNSLKRIGNGAFRWCSNLQTINLYNSLTHIGEEAFWGCINLQTINLPNSLKRIGDGAFGGCSDLQAINLSDSLMHIGEKAFLGCNNLQTIDISSNNLNFRSIDGVVYSFGLETLICYPIGKSISSFYVPNGVNYIEDWAFSECKNLQTINLPNSLKRIGDGAFRGCSSLQTINLPNSLKHIGDKAFSVCENLESIHLPDSLTHIGEEVFYRCKNLQTISLPNSLMHIGEKAFSECENLQTIHLPDSLTHIGDKVFYRCKNLQTISLPNSLMHIGEEVFSKCVNLQKIDVASNNLNFRSINGVIYSYDLFALIFYPSGKSISSFHVPDGVNYIRDNAFSDCENLQTIYLPNSLKRIGNGAFRWCSNLQTINLYNSLTHIGEEAFWGCINLQTINLPNSLKRIGDGAFAWCYYLQTIHLPDSLMYIGDEVFDKCENLQTIYIPRGTKDRFMSLIGWRFRDELVERKDR